MRSATINPTECGPDRSVCAVVWLIVALTLTALPLKIIRHGFLPPDDALRHAAKAASGKPWSEILVLRPEITIDHNPGWHTVLTFVHRATGWGPKPLVIFSILSMFLLFAAAPLPWLKRPELWLASLALLMLAFPYFAERSFIGRPFFLTMAVTLVLLCLWTDPGTRAVSKTVLVVTTLLISLSTWIHGSWYLLALIPLAFALAREWRKALLLGTCWAAGSMLGAAFTGQPFTFLYQSALIPLLALRPNAPVDSLVGEFQPLGLTNTYPALILIVVVLGCWKIAGRPLRPIWRDPIFWLAILGLVLGIRVVRFWLDWGLPALALWLARQSEDLLEKQARSIVRLATAAAAALALFFIVGSDRDGRWGQYGRFEPLDARRPEHAEWLPPPGGILYSVNLSVFYETFFTNPRGPWRYALGFEPSFMTAENLVVYDDLWRTLDAVRACAPWVQRMTSADRLVLLGTPETPPAVPELKWHYAAANTWIGRRAAMLQE